jgi:hypothetical protein
MDIHDIWGQAMGPGQTFKYDGYPNNPNQLNYTQQPPQSIWNGGGLTMNDRPQDFPNANLEPPQPPWENKWQGDPSGLVSAGMEAPALPNPMKEIAGIMAMTNIAQRAARPNSPMPQGGLMAYLSQLGV